VQSLSFIAYEWSALLLIRCQQRHSISTLQLASNVTFTSNL
jgi:hypothetical protein